MTSPPETLLERVALGDADAVALCLERYAPLVHAMARRWLGAVSDADDVVQDVFVQVWNSAGKYDPARASERGWIAMITRRKLIDRSRRGRSGPVTDNLEENAGFEVGVSDHGLRSVELRDEAGRVHEAMEDLDAELRGLLCAAVIEGETHTEISARTGLPLGTVKSRLRRGLLRLRESLGVAQAKSGEARA